MSDDREVVGDDWMKTMKDMKKEMDASHTYTLSQFCLWQNVVEHQEEFTSFLLREGRYRTVYDKRDWSVLVDCCDRCLLYHIC